MADITIEQAIEKMKRKAEAVERGEYNREIGDEVQRSIRQNYLSGGRVPSWPERQRAYPWAILWKTGKKKSTEEGSSQNWRRSVRQWVLSVKSTSYGVFHQFGHGQEVRKSVKLVPEEIRRITSIIIETIKGA